MIGLAEGEVEGLANGYQSILLEDTPLQDENGNKNFENVTVNFRSGTNDQEYIEGFPAVENEIPIDVELKSSTPWVRSFNNLDLDAVRLRLRWGPLRSKTQQRVMLLAIPLSTRWTCKLMAEHGQKY